MAIKEFFKKLLKNPGKKLLTVAAITTIPMALVACNDPTPTPTPTPDVDPVEETKQVGIVSVLEKNAAYKNLDKSAESAITDKIVGAVADEYYTQKKNVQLVDVQFGGADNNQATIVAKVDGSKVVLVKYESEQLGNFKSITDKQAFVLGEAGYTSQTKVDEDKQSEADAKITSAVKSVISKLSSLDDDAKVIQANEIFDGISGDGKDISGFEKYQGVILSEVRQDGTVIAFTYSDGKYNDHVLTVNGKDDLTNDQILSEIKSGEFEITTRTIDPSETYTAPAVEEKPVVEYVNFNEIYNEIFGEDFAFTSPTELFDSVLPTIQTYATSTDLIMYAAGDNLTILSECISKQGRTSLEKLTYNGENFKDIKQYCDLYCESSGSLEEYLKIELIKNDIVKGSSEEAALRTELEKYGAYVLNGQQKIKSLAENEFIHERQINATKDEIDSDAFGEKLCPDKEVIATYVGALEGKQLDSVGRFNTGYYTGFNTVTVYRDDNDDVIIKQDKIYVPYYNDSTNESLYKTFSEGKDETKYNIVSQETETIKNATIAERNEGKKLALIQVLNGYDISSLDEETAKIVADIMAEYLNS